MTPTTDFDALAASAVQLTEDNAKLLRTLDEVLRQFTQRADLGGPCVRTSYVPETIVELWRETLAELTTPAAAKAAPSIAAGADYPAATEDAEEPSCALCGCTEDKACEGGCAWFSNRLGRDLCTACVSALIDDATELHVEEIYLVTDPDAAEPRAWLDQADAAEAALEAVRADWASSMGSAPAVFLLKPTGTGDGAPRWEVVVNAPASDVLNDPTGVTLHRLALHGPHLRPEDIWSPGCTMYGLGQRGEHDLAPFTSPRMPEAEARRRLAQMRELFPEDEHVLLRWNIGPAVIVRDDQEKDAPTSSFPTDNEAISDANQPPDTAPEGP